MAEYESLKAAREMAAAERVAFEQSHAARKMTLTDFEGAISQLLSEAVASGLEPDDLVNCGVAMIENTFLDDPESA